MGINQICDIQNTINRMGNIKNSIDRINTLLQSLRGYNEFSESIDNMNNVINLLEFKIEYQRTHTYLPNLNDQIIKYNKRKEYTKQLIARMLHNKNIKKAYFPDRHTNG